MANRQHMNVRLRIKELMTGALRKHTATVQVQTNFKQNCQLNPFEKPDSRTVI